MTQPNISARIIADSVNPAGVRLTSYLLRYPRFIHSELMTHRAFSRNAASSRAIPFNKMVDAVYTNPAKPERWAAEQKGMQGGDEIETPSNGKHEWVMASGEAIARAKKMAADGIHKSLCNRLLEPFAHITVLVTATEAGLANFFALRAHKDAMPEFQVLAYRMLDEYAHLKGEFGKTTREPWKLDWGQWHVPDFIGSIKHPADFPEGYSQEQWVKIATARCARLSYLTFDGEHSPAKDIELHDRLKVSGHFSPFEHCAQAVPHQDYPTSNFDALKPCDYSQYSWQPSGPLHYGFSHWLQYRKTLENECVTKIDPAAILAGKPGWITL